MMERVTDEQEREAYRVLERAYEQDVEDAAQSLIEQLKDGDFESYDEWAEAIDSAADNDQRVIYTFQAMKGMICTDDADVGIEELGAESFDFSDGIPWSQLMYFSFRADILKELDREGYGDLYNVCDDCGVLLHPDNVSAEDDDVCAKCMVERNKIRCEDCDEEIESGDLCDDCREEREEDEDDSTDTTTL